MDISFLPPANSAAQTTPNVRYRFAFFRSVAYSRRKSAHPCCRRRSACAPSQGTSVSASSASSSRARTRCVWRRDGARLLQISSSSSPKTHAAAAHSSTSRRARTTATVACAFHAKKRLRRSTERAAAGGSGPMCSTMRPLLFWQRAPTARRSCPPDPLSGLRPGTRPGLRSCTPRLIFLPTRPPRRPTSAGSARVQ